VWGLKSQIGDQEGLGGKLSDENKKTILAAVKDATEWIDSNGQSATADELDEKLAGSSIYDFYPYFLLMA
jgi:endoplasmic reticulum chaperone BiP